jgi:hypothetical protein
MYAILEFVIDILQVRVTGHIHSPAYTLPSNAISILNHVDMWF